MDTNGMTPAQLRALADEMERPSGIDAEEHERRIEAIRGGKSPESRGPGYMRHVEIDGIPLDIDMRAVTDIRTTRTIAKVQKGGADAAFAAIELFDRILGDQVGRVEAALGDEDGYCSAERYSDFAARIFEAVGAKN